MELETIKSNWKLLGKIKPAALSPAIDQIHRGLQFIAMVGKHFVKNQADDSHTNLRWLPQEEVLAGNWVRDRKGNFRFAMRPKDLTLIVFDSNMQPVSDFPLNGKTNKDALSWVKKRLTALGKDESQMKMDIHYDLPIKVTEAGNPYDNSDLPPFQEIAKYRANAHFMLEHCVAKFEHASNVRTWPHHFDTGSYIPVVFDKKGDPVKSFSLGFAIADAVVDEPYFYITQWSAKKDIDYGTVSKPSKGEWFPEALGGAALRASTVAKSKTAKAQASMVIQYFKEGIAASEELIK